jgi:4-amino-4-deoxy-L-arabinose transferase-like glycosyltransferase
VIDPTRERTPQGEARAPNSPGAAPDRWGRATAALLLAAAVVVLFTFRQYGSTWDEAFQSEVGQDAVAWFRTLGKNRSALTGGSQGNLHLYGGLFEVAAELAGRVSPIDPVETRHLLNALVALAGVWGCALLARRLGGARAGFLAAALLLTTPPWWGHGFANSKDIPFAAVYPWLLLAMLRLADELPRPRPSRVAAAGAALGVALALRPGGLLVLLPLAAVTVAVRLLPVLRSAGAGSASAALHALVRFGAVAGIGWLGMIAAWPYGLVHPLRGPAEAVAAARSFRWDGPVRFAGTWVQSTDLPRRYAPEWFLATLPETWPAIAATCAIAAIVWARRRAPPASPARSLDVALVAAAGLAPIAGAAVLRPVLYDGVRHLLFVLPALAAVAGAGLSRSLEVLPRPGRIASLAAVAALAALAVADAVRLHPYQYVYFNRALAGGLARASRDFDLDYWAASSREAMRWVVANVPPRGGRPLVVATSAHPWVADHWLTAEERRRFAFEESDAPDLRLETTRFFAHRATGKVLHVVERMGVPLLYVLEPFAKDTPMVLEGGEGAIALSPAGAWVGTPAIVPGVPEPEFRLRRVLGTPAEADAWLLTRATGGVPEAEDLRDDVARLAAARLGTGPEVEPQKIAGATATGWIVVGRPGARPGFPFCAAAGVRFGDAALLLVARFAGDPEASSRELLWWLRGARPALPAERRPP